jgi:hypothetical protein
MGDITIPAARQYGMAKLQRTGLMMVSWSRYQKVHAEQLKVSREMWRW